MEENFLIGSQRRTIRDWLCEPEPGVDASDSPLVSVSIWPRRFSDRNDFLSRMVWSRRRSVIAETMLDADGTASKNKVYSIFKIFYTRTGKMAFFHFLYRAKTLRSYLCFFAQFRKYLGFKRRLWVNKSLKK